MMLSFLKNKYSIAYILLQPFSTAFDVGAAYVLMIAIDYATSGSLEKLPWYVAGFLSYIVLQFCVDLVTKRVKEKAVTTAVMQLRSSLMSKILAMNTQVYAQKNSGSYLAYITKSTEKIDSIFFRKLCDFYPQILQFTASVCLLFWLDWRLALFVLITSSIQILVPKCLVPPARTAQSRAVAAHEKYTIAVKEIFEAFDVIKSYNLQQKIAVLHQNANELHGAAVLKSATLDCFTDTLSHLLSSIVYFGVFFLGAILVLLGVFKISVIIAASQLVIFIVFPLGVLTRTITAIFAAKEIIQELDSILTQETAALPLVEKRSFEQHIVFDHVRFIYPTSQNAATGVVPKGQEKTGEDLNTDALQPALDDITFSIKKGEKILLIGESGSGKSTLLSLLYKKITGYTGSISIDGVDIRNISDEDFFQLVTVVHQNPFIFDDTIRNNITLYGTFDEADFEKAVETAGLKDFIEKLPNKYDTKIGEDGSSISGGEKQRIAIARALIKNTPIILFDEAVSALDADTAQRIETKLLSDADKTYIIISHHVSSSLQEQADRIITIKNTHLSHLPKINA
ncbi:MAG: ABC transporter ATP-binding protein [Treponema sp.]